MQAHVVEAHALADASTITPKTWGFGAQHNVSDTFQLFSGCYIADQDNGTPKTKMFNIGSRVIFN